SGACCRETARADRALRVRGRRRDGGSSGRRRGVPQPAGVRARRGTLGPDRRAGGGVPARVPAQVRDRWPRRRHQRARRLGRLPRRAGRTRESRHHDLDLGRLPRPAPEGREPDPELPAAHRLHPGRRRAARADIGPSRTDEHVARHADRRSPGPSALRPALPRKAAARGRDACNCVLSPRAADRSARRQRRRRAVDPRRARVRHRARRPGAARRPCDRAGRPRLRMSLASPYLLVSLLALPAAAAIYLISERRRMRYAVRYTNVDVLASVAGGRAWRRLVAPALLVLALAALCVAVTRPRISSIVTSDKATVVLVL